MVDIDYEKLLTDYPFLTYLIYGENEYIGIIQNVDDIVTTIYDYSALQSIEEKQLFLQLADTWWWESNRSIPINIFLKQDWEQFRPFLKTFINKDLDIILGPATSLAELSRKKIKRRSITLVRKVD